jgi:hypothetical protein
VDVAGIQRAEQFRADATRVEEQNALDTTLSEIGRCLLRERSALFVWEKM